MSTDEIKEWFPTLEFLDFYSQASNQREAVEKGVSIEALYQEKTGKSHLLEDVKDAEEVRNSVQ